MKTYKSTKPFILSVSGQKNPIQFAKNQVICVDGNKLHVQGRVESLKVDILDNILESGNIVEVFNLDENYLRENVLPHPELIRLKKTISKAKTKLKQYLSVLETIGKWAFLPKGSGAVNISTEVEFQKNPNQVLSQTILGEGNRAKPGCYVMNRGLTRNGVYATKDDELIWQSDKSTLLPYGIRQSDYASQSEMVKIYKKLIQQVCSMEDCPQDFRDFFNIELCVVPDITPFKDYLRLIDRETRQDMGYPNLYFSDFSKNQHHSKENGLEFCHLDPWHQDFTTNVDNITIGSSRANRLQGGYPISYIQETFK
jgi:hypothetical protein